MWLTKQIYAVVASPEAMKVAFFFWKCKVSNISNFLKIDKCPSSSDYLLIFVADISSFFVLKTDRVCVYKQFG